MTHRIGQVSQPCSVRVARSPRTVHCNPRPGSPPNWFKQPNWFKRKMETSTSRGCAGAARA